MISPPKKQAKPTPTDAQTRRQEDSDGPGPRADGMLRDRIAEEPLKMVGRHIYIYI